MQVLDPITKQPIYLTVWYPQLEFVILKDKRFQTHQVPDEGIICFRAITDLEPRSMPAAEFKIFATEYHKDAWAQYLRSRELGDLFT
jgi:hypothetical protein